MPLTAKLKKQFKAQAHALKPIVLIGNHGLTPNVQAEIDLALNHHELIKIRLSSEDRLTRQAMATEIIASQKAEQIQLIGKVLTIYRKAPKK